jgi:hypothetical protein
MNVGQSIRDFFKPRQTAEPDKSVFEQQKEIIDEAEQFDRLTRDPAWLKALEYMADQVNSSLIEATTHKEDPAKMMWQVVRWDAKRELLDDLQARVSQPMAERDRIVQELKELENARRDAFTGN